MNLKNIFYKFPVTLGVLTVAAWLIYGLIIQVINPISNQNLGVGMRLNIIAVNQSSPHFVLQKEDGVTLNANFPYDLTRSGIRQYLISTSEAKRLSGCFADIQIVELKTLFGGEYRVLQLMCNGFFVSSREIVAAYEGAEGGRFRAIKAASIFGLIAFGLYVDLRRRVEL